MAVDKKESSCEIIDFAVPGDSRNISRLGKGVTEDMEC